MYVSITHSLNQSINPPLRGIPLGSQHQKELGISRAPAWFWLEAEWKASCQVQVSPLPGSLGFSDCAMRASQAGLEGVAGVSKV